METALAQVRFVALHPLVCRPVAAYRSSSQHSQLVNSLLHELGVNSN